MELIQEEGAMVIFGEGDFRRWDYSKWGENRTSGIYHIIIEL